MAEMNSQFHKGEIWLAQWEWDDWHGTYFYRPVLILENGSGGPDNRIYVSPVGGLVRGLDDLYMPVGSEEMLFSVVYAYMDAIIKIPKKRVAEKVMVLSGEHVQEVDEMLQRHFGLYIPN